MDNNSGAKPLLASHLSLAMSAAVEAGRCTIDYFKTDFEVREKLNKTVVTEADVSSSNIIRKHLTADGSNLICEEGEQIPYEERREWERYWLIDPLDGTREFVARRNHWTVNISLMQNNFPIFGLIYSPVYDRVWFAAEKEGAYRMEKLSVKFADSVESIIEGSAKLPDQEAEQFTILASQTHISWAVDAYIAEMQKKHGSVALMRMGSAEKLCRLAEGTAHIYPRFGPTMEWDTAAGHIILLETGKNIYHHETNEPITYNKENLLNPWFIAK